MATEQAARPVAAVALDWKDTALPSLCSPEDQAANGRRYRVEQMMRKAQDKLCMEMERVTGMTFRQDSWVRDNYGGGITRVMQGGDIIEKGGVNMSVVYSKMSPVQYEYATGSKLPCEIPENPEPIDFAVAALSCVFHTTNPKAPSMHFNYRYFETEPWNGMESQWWWGGGQDTTPTYIEKDDLKFFHGSLKEVCDKHDPEYYPKFKKWCDEYFVIPFRGESRGTGGVFFDNLNDKPWEDITAFISDMLDIVGSSWIPTLEKRMNEEYNEKEKEFQQVRRGRYIEFNLCCDRGTNFGLKAKNGRVESCLMTMPLTASWVYEHEIEEGSPEADAVDAFKNPREWV